MDVIGGLLCVFGSCNRKFSSVIGSLLYVAGSCERHSKPTKEMYEGQSESS